MYAATAADIVANLLGTDREDAERARRLAGCAPAPGLMGKWSKGGGALQGEKVVRPHVSG